VPKGTESEMLEGKGIVGNAASINAPCQRLSATGELTDGGLNPLLHLVLNPPVLFQRDPGQPRQEHHPAVLAGTVVAKPASFNRAAM
jgi:hypothetical protein